MCTGIGHIISAIFSRYMGNKQIEADEKRMRIIAANKLKDQNDEH